MGGRRLGEAGGHGRFHARPNATDHRGVPVRSVMFPPGWARLAMSPEPTGSPANITIGIVAVARLAARDGWVPNATIILTLSCTSSAARPGSRSRFPSAYRDSNVRFWPTIQPRSLNRSRNTRRPSPGTSLRAALPEDKTLSHGGERAGDHDGPDRSNRFHVGWWRGVKPTHRHFAQTVAICERSWRWSR